MRYELGNTRSAVLAPNTGTTTMRPTIGRGPAGRDGANVLPTDEAVGDALAARELPTTGAELLATIGASTLDGGSP